MLTHGRQMLQNSFMFGRIEFSIWLRVQFVAQEHLGQLNQGNLLVMFSMSLCLMECFESLVAEGRTWLWQLRNVELVAPDTPYHIPMSKKSKDKQDNTNDPVVTHVHIIPDRHELSPEQELRVKMHQDTPFSSPAQCSIGRSYPGICIGDFERSFHVKSARTDVFPSDTPASARF